MTEVVQSASVYVGVDTHADIHHLAVVDPLGRSLADRTFPTTTAGYEQMVRWCAQFGDVVAVGVEGTSSYGAALTRRLRDAGMSVVEVDRPDRKSRRLHGKTDALDAYSAARAVAAGRATAVPKGKDGLVESIRCLHVARRSAVKARTQAINQIRGMLTTGPVELREQLRGLGTKALIKTVARLRPAADASDPAVAVKIAIRGLARRCQELNEEIEVLDGHLTRLTARAAPALLERPGVGVDTVAQLLITAGDNPERVRSEAAFARLTGVAPIPASSGRTDRHRLSRGGDRQANRALHTIVLVRMYRDEKTQEYVQRRTQQGLGKKDIIRCLKRAVAREIYHHLRAATPERERSRPL
ncbi:IS110 family transposase [Cellulomonas sp. ATA003]|uniref:IS110 family transposase n=1 Tax=Cellulomonas sp. ATA003 TaxID=3073064 RepID=UPI00287385FB|nr:IS110 family transposase [Cellulomonas sp. ATA003]WNB84338.1 IS110 family transposase [Cellulomonas sp. ATA003]WNB86976.1 IS110 family transposase [Cellulomonas sp. ATA003]